MSPIASLAERRILAGYVRAALDEQGHTDEARDLARLCALQMKGGRRAYAAAVLAADPGWRRRRR